MPNKRLYHKEAEIWSKECDCLSGDLICERLTGFQQDFIILQLWQENIQGVRLQAAG